MDGECGPGGALWRCFCGKSFPSSTRYRKHLRLHSAERTHCCSHAGCDKSYKRLSHLQRHVLSHLEEAKKPHACPREGCEKSFTSRQKLAKHLRSHDGLKCETCGKKFRKKTYLDRHVLSHLRADSDEADGGLLRCPKCGEAARNELDLRRHILRHREHRCPECPALVFGNHRALVLHRRLTHCRPHLCEECGKVYQREASLLEHWRRAHLDAEAVCPEPGCQQVFGSLGGLRMHIRVVHRGLRPFRCPQCGRTFAYRNVLNRHVLCQHAVATQPVAPNAPPFAGIGGEEGTEAVDEQEDEEEEKEEKMSSSTGLEDEGADAAQVLGAEKDDREGGAHEREAAEGADEREERRERGAQAAQVLRPSLAAEAAEVLGAAKAAEAAQVLGAAQGADAAPVFGADLLAHRKRRRAACC